jgi:hypothetical protein
VVSSPQPVGHASWPQGRKQATELQQTIQRGDPAPSGISCSWLIVSLSFLFVIASYCYG